MIVIVANVINIIALITGMYQKEKKMNQEWGNCILAYSYLFSAYFAILEDKSLMLIMLSALGSILAFKNYIYIEEAQ